MLGRLWPANDRDEPHDATVTVEADGERVIRVETADLVDGEENCIAVRFSSPNNGSTDAGRLVSGVLSGQSIAFARA